MNIAVTHIGEDYGIVEVTTTVEGESETTGFECEVPKALAEALATPGAVLTGHSD